MYQGEGTIRMKEISKFTMNKILAETKRKDGSITNNVDDF